ncbi:MAG: 3D domain-containing protein [Fimbriimonadales bacterium]|nr:3D domain-containing protein [Fimbriimonadales bacterium]
MRQRRNADRGGLWRGLLVGLSAVVLSALGCAENPRDNHKTTTQIVERRELTPPPTLFEVNRRLPPRHKVLKAEGRPGEKLVIWRVYYRNGKLVRRVKLEEQILEPPQPRIYEIGVHGHIASRGAVGRNAAFRTTKILEMRASAYTPHRSGGGTGTGRTATGLPAGYGLVAVDPRVIPLGTVLYVEGYGMAIAADTGRAIKGYKIDLCYATRRQAFQFGRRKVRVHILRAAPAAPPPKPPNRENANDHDKNAENPP